MAQPKLHYWKRAEETTQLDVRHQNVMYGSHKKRSPTDTQTLERTLNQDQFYIHRWRQHIEIIGEIKSLTYGS